MIVLKERKKYVSYGGLERDKVMHVSYNGLKGFYKQWDMYFY